MIQCVPSILWDVLQAPTFDTPTEHYQGHLPNGSGVQRHSADALYLKADEACKIAQLSNQCGPGIGQIDWFWDRRAKARADLGHVLGEYALEVTK